jgi:probable rRNA maturation factor
MVIVEVDPDYKNEVSAKELTTLVNSVFELQQLPSSGSLSVRVTSSSFLRQLNQMHLGIDAPTDVLTFPMDFDDPESGGHYFGDIILSYEKAAAQAEENGHAVINEIKLLVIHGILHLLGYDHASAEEKEEMWTIQNKLLAALGIKATPTE